VTPIRAIAREFDETGGGTTATGEVIFGLHVVNALTTMALAAESPQARDGLGQRCVRVIGPGRPAAAL
jgi:hypothetical protein